MTGCYTRQHVFRDKDIVFAASFPGCMCPCLRLTDVVLVERARGRKPVGLEKFRQGFPGSIGGLCAEGADEVSGCVSKWGIGIYKQPAKSLGTTLGEDSAAFIPPGLGSLTRRRLPWGWVRLAWSM